MPCLYVRSGTIGIAEKVVTKAVLLFIVMAMTACSRQGSQITVPAELAIRYGVSDAVCSEGNWSELELTDEQKDHIGALQKLHAAEYNEMVRKTWGVDPGEEINDSHQQVTSPEIAAILANFEKEFENSLLDELRPVQIAKAKAIVIRKRMELGASPLSHKAPIS